MKKRWLLMGVVVIIFLDQISKHYVLQCLPGRGYVSVFPGLQLLLTYNHGVAFSLFYNIGLNKPWILMVMTGLLCTVLLIMFYKTHDSERQKQLALMLILGGALSNLFDRAYYGAVIDFIDVYVGKYHWPVFNLADSAICLGALLLLLLKERNEKEA